MASYKLTENAELDLIRIHQRGVLEFGEQRADKYYWAFFDRFEQIAKQPMAIRLSMTFALATAEASAASTVSIIESKNMSS